MKGKPTLKEMPPVWPEYLQFLAFYLLTVALIKIAAAYFLDRNASSAVGNGLAWFQL